MITRRWSLLIVAGLALVGCSSPAEPVVAPEPKGYLNRVTLEKAIVASEVWETATCVPGSGLRTMECAQGAASRVSVLHTYRISEDGATIILIKSERAP